MPELHIGTGIRVAVGSFLHTFSRKSVSITALLIEKKEVKIYTL